MNSSALAQINIFLFRLFYFSFFVTFFYQMLKSFFQYRNPFTRLKKQVPQNVFFYHPFFPSKYSTFFLMEEKQNLPFTVWIALQKREQNGSKNSFWQQIFITLWG
jgi:hypothetical protein